MNITLEQIEELRSLTKVSFAEAERALRRSKGDLPRAIAKIEHKKNSYFTKISDKLARIIKRFLNYRLVIKRHDVLLLNLSVITVILIGLFIPHLTLIHIVAIILIGLLTECDFRIINTQAHQSEHSVPTSTAKLMAIANKDEIIVGANNSKNTKNDIISTAKGQDRPQRPDVIVTSQQIHEDAEGYNEIIIK